MYMYKYICVHCVCVHKHICVYTDITNELDIVMQKLKKNNLSSQGLSQDSRLHLKKRKGGERRESRAGKIGGREGGEQKETQHDTSINTDTQTKGRKISGINLHIF